MIFVISEAAVYSLKLSLIPQIKVYLKRLEHCQLQVIKP